MILQQSDIARLDRLRGHQPYFEGELERLKALPNLTYEDEYQLNKYVFHNIEGKTLVKVAGLKQGSSDVLFYTEDSQKYLLYHDQDCCETVLVEDVIGDPNDLMQTPILRFSVRSNKDENPPGYTPEGSQESFTWTFYRIVTIKGTVVIRWYGVSNGCYSEEVSFKRD